MPQQGAVFPAACPAVHDTLGRDRAGKARLGSATDEEPTRCPSRCRVLHLSRCVNLACRSLRSRLRREYAQPPYQHCPLNLNLHCCLPTTNCSHGCPAHQPPVVPHTGFVVAEMPIRHPPTHPGLLPFDSQPQPLTWVPPPPPLLPGAACASARRTGRATPTGTASTFITSPNKWSLRLCLCCDVVGC